jgi:hypothetical protein
MRRTLLGLVWFGVALGTAVCGAAAQTPSPNVYHSLESGKPARPANDVNGQIVSVDYPSGMLVVRDGGRDRTIAVVPSTAIYRKGQYATLADLRPGQHVAISVYEVSGRLVAQTIRL